MNVSFENTVIESLELVRPPELVTSDALEARLAPAYERIGLAPGRIEMMTGIRERAFWPSGTPASLGSAEAGRAALAVSGVAADRIGLLMHCAVCRDRIEPATASYVHGAIGLGRDCLTFDVSNACLGFLNGLVIAANMIERGQIDHALVVSAENGKPLVERTIRTLNEDASIRRKEIKPYIANLTIGAAAVGAVVSRKDRAQRQILRLVGGASLSDSSANELCQGDTSGDEIEMLTDSEELLKAGVALVQKTFAAYQTHLDWPIAETSRYLLHQVGRRHQIAVFESLGLPIEKDFSTFPTWGNCGSASLPLTLGKALSEGQLSAGERASLIGIGSGLVCMCLGVEAL